MNILDTHAPGPAPRVGDLTIVVVLRPRSDAIDLDDLGTKRRIEDRLHGPLCKAYGFDIGGVGDFEYFCVTHLKDFDAWNELTQDLENSALSDLLEWRVIAIGRQSLVDQFASRTV